MTGRRSFAPGPFRRRLPVCVVLRQQRERRHRIGHAQFYVALEDRRAAGLAALLGCRELQRPDSRRVLRGHPEAVHIAVVDQHQLAAHVRVGLRRQPAQDGAAVEDRP